MTVSIKKIIWRTLIMLKECVRNHAVRCMKSKFGYSINDEEALFGKYKSVEDLLNHHSYNEILNLVCNEKENYQTLKNYYDQAIKSNINNVFFIFANKIDHNYKLYVTKDGQIIIYYYQDRIRIGEKSIFPWDYPHCINCIGNCGHYKELEIVKDFMSLNTFDFYIKYTLQETCFIRDTKFNQEDKRYIVNDILQVEISSHITFYSGMNDMKGYYIADSWWSDDQEILEDLSKMPIISFGEKYHAFWRT